MSYYFFLGDVMLPVPPESVSLKISNKNATIDLINEGEVSLIKTPGLSEINFDARLPNRKYPFATYDTSLDSDMGSSIFNTHAFQKAEYYLNKFEKMKTDKKPVRLIIVRMVADMTPLHTTNMMVTLEDYSIEESVSEGVDVVCPLTLRQYKKYRTKECEITTNEDGTKTIKVKEVREAEDRDTPRAMRVATELSVLECAKKALNGSLNWQSAAINSGMLFPAAKPDKGMVLHFG